MKLIALEKQNLLHHPKSLTWILVSLVLTVVSVHQSPLHAQSLPLIGGSSIAKASNWTDLSTVQKEILSSLEEDWPNLTVDQRVKWIQLANRYDNLTNTEKERLKSRMADWSKLPINEKRIARANYLNSLAISNDQKLEAWEAYQQLSAEEKKELAEHALSKKQKKPSLVNSPSLKTN
ncbi:DUF3106 domain-containing protein [Polynucleobacter kasalickyi]|uniref:DUF3106 domain-containing protein n=1 Tax=Polynucleobacter kasalickyi TaxID=1938817 RepID=A0A1W1ZTC5_9BURK|nr:DUF3106 domain-containing protein [Polynucleobacter kasalickyi]SMC51616.1 Protein of unknown function [Polynucleobacter kasalickyi]